MTGERMETVLEALDALNLIGMNGVPTACTLAVNALAEVERWERDRARLEAIETAAKDVLYQYEGTALKGSLAERQLLRLRAALAGDPPRSHPKDAVFAALGVGQDSDLAEPPEAAATPTESGGFPEGNDGGTGGSARPLGECPCDGDRGCVCQ